MTENAQEKQLGMLCHLLAFSGLIIPCGSILGPLVLWLLKKNESSFVDDQGKESLNFQITVLLAGIVSFILCFVVIGFILALAVAVAWIIYTILGAIKASEGVAYRYPYTLRLIK